MPATSPPNRKFYHSVVLTNAHRGKRGRLRPEVRGKRDISLLQRATSRITRFSGSRIASGSKYGRQEQESLGDGLVVIFA